MWCAMQPVNNTGLMMMWTEPVQVEAHADLGRYREADTALEAAARRDPSFASTKEYKSLAEQLTAHLQGLPKKRMHAV